MNKKGYIASLFVSGLFLAVFIIAITSMKSVSVMQESTYEKISIMKVTGLSRNIEDILDPYRAADPSNRNYQAFCIKNDGLRETLDGIGNEVPANIIVDCDPDGSTGCSSRGCLDIPIVDPVASRAIGHRLR